MEAVVPFGMFPTMLIGQSGQGRGGLLGRAGGFLGKGAERIFRGILLRFFAAAPRSKFDECVIDFTKMVCKIDLQK